jgi:hypothetical protein
MAPVPKTDDRCVITGDRFWPTDGPRCERTDVPGPRRAIRHNLECDADSEIHDILNSGRLPFGREHRLGPPAIKQHGRLWISLARHLASAAGACLRIGRLCGHARQSRSAGGVASSTPCGGEKWMQPKQARANWFYPISFNLPVAQGAAKICAWHGFPILSVCSPKSAGLAADLVEAVRAHDPTRCLAAIGELEYRREPFTRAMRAIAKAAAAARRFQTVDAGSQRGSAVRDHSTSALDSCADSAAPSRHGAPRTHGRLDDLARRRP